MSPPLISDYKKGFTVKRLFETFLGGPRLFFTPPVYIALQVVLFILPAIILCAVNLAFGNWGAGWKAIIVGLALLVTDLALAVGLSFLKRIKPIAISPIFSRRGSIPFLMEEDHVEYEGLLHRSTWVFVAPNVSINEPFYIVGIVSCATAFIFCTPLIIIEETGNTILRAFGLFALCIAKYSAVVSLPPEVATFDPIRQRNRFYRPFYANVLGLGHLIVLLSRNEPDYSFWFLLCLSAFPFLWSAGVLPPLDALFPWLAETVLKIMGGSPTYFYIGNFMALLVGLICPVILFISRLPVVFIIIVECLLGYVISCDIGKGLLKCLKTHSISENRQKKIFTILHFLKPGLSVLLSLICACIPMSFVIPEKPTDIILLIISFVIVFISFLLRQFLIGKTTKTKLLDKVYIIHAVIDFSITFILHFWIAVQISSKQTNRLSLKQLMIQILAIRAFALSITHPRLSWLDISISTFLKFYGCVHFENIEFIILFFIVSILRERFFVFLRNLSFIGIVLFSTAQSVLLGNVFQVIGTIFLLLPYSILSFIIASLVEGTTMSALFTLPIFLIGFPRPNSFWKGFWFPKSAVNMQGAKKDLDWIIYSEITKPLMNVFVKYFRRAHLKLEPGNCYLARYDDRLLFLRIITSGWNFAYIQVKGLEMQEQTSCHHQEAASVDEIFGKAFGPDRKSLFSSHCHRSPGILQPLMTFTVNTYSESKSSILNLKTKGEKAVFQKMFFKTFTYLWMKTNPLFHGIDAYRKSICSGYNLHSTENSSVSSTPLNSSFDFGLSSDTFSSELMISYPNSIDDLNNRNTGRGIGKSFGNELPVWTLSHLPALPGMEIRKTKSESKNSTKNICNNERRGSKISTTPYTSWLTTSWVNKCVGDLILAPGAKDKVEELCWDIWTIIFSDSNDLIQIDLQRFFDEEFVGDFLQKMKIDGLSLADVSIQSFRYAVKLTLDEIYNSFEATSEEEIFTELTFFEEHCIRFCTPSEIGFFIQQKEERIISMHKTEDGSTQLKIFNYETSGVEFSFGQMDRSCVEGIWANLNLELLYLTSDDDERFSIQQDKYLMRNITTQCANSPLGYPVYEATFRVNLFNFNIDQV